LEEIKTSISEIKQTIQLTCEMVKEFKHDQIAYSAEDLVYQLMIIEAKYNLKTELERAKKLIDGNKHRTKRKD
jgi:hypothetical protein